MASIPVLITFPRHASLLASSLIAVATPVAARRSGRQRGTPSLPSWLSLDDRFGAVPLGPAETAPGQGFAMAAAVAPEEEAPEFIVRGSIDDSRIDEATELPDGVRVFADPRIEAPALCGGDPAKGTAADVRALLKVDALRRRGLTGDGVALAIVDAGINLAHLRDLGLAPTLDHHLSWSNQLGNAAGKQPLGHGTMSAYDALIAAPRAVLLDFPILSAPHPDGGTVMSGMLSDAVRAYGELLSLMRQPEASRPYSALVVNNSWGMFHPSWDFPSGHPGRYSDNPQHPFNRQVASLSTAGADIVFAAGNCGAECPDFRCKGVTTDSITGANALAQVVTVAGVDTDGDRVGYSSQGPGIAGMAKEKPDL
ncbi:MAG: S8 family serine peptidase, partial [Alphaproteobacteria bacterium]|nr:S8 family serine peptidase [Alphaproteobacteria bacterium]